MKSKSLLLKTVLAGFVKALAAVIAFIMTAAVTRSLGAAEAGLFLLSITVLTFTGVFFRLGLDNVILKVVSADGGGSYSVGVVTTALFAAFFCSFIFAVLVFNVAGIISIQVFSKPSFEPVLSIMIWALPFMLVYFLLSFAFQGFYRVVLAIWFQNLGVSFVFLVLVLIAYFTLGISKFTAEGASQLYLSAVLLTCVLAVIFWHHQIKGRWERGNIRDKKLWGSASNHWIASSMILCVEWSGLLIAGMYVTSEEVAYLSTAQRTATLAGFVLMVANMVVAPRYARLWTEGKIKEFQQLARWSTRAVILMALPIVAIMVCFPEVIMQLFGPEFIQAANLLAIMAVGQFICVSTGSVRYLLGMTGHEKDFRRVTFFSGPFTIILNLILIPFYGVLGAAIGTAVGLAVQNTFALIMVRKRLGFWPIG